ncbi:type IV pilus assembly protein FimV [Allopusillimonas ginsengisoli]|uniref:type IV pilus assembly protein FimV n=1 Tax=Allopusillimonas ginsengisoli TaxID=453575 RepID=UPI001430C096|nr:FimV/HubP family polar landmark protein [Allopusillimonas ginsengisoli]
MAATLGHSRLVSALGQPLRIDVQVAGLAPADVGKLAASPAPQSDWLAAGLVPPVDLASLKLSVADGYTRGSKIIQVRSSQAFDKPVADLLLDVSTPSGQQRYQVSLLTRSQSAAPQPVSGADVGGGAGGQGGYTAKVADAPSIRVRRGDNMFKIAYKHAVKDVTVYQMMMALQRANPQAFIEENINLVKAGATLKMPDMAALTAISDREARRLFQEQAQAFALYRQRLAAGVGAVGDKDAAASGVVSAGGEGPLADDADKGPRDQLRLSEKAEDGNADDNAATRANIDESVQRVSQLEENVQHLNEALQAQGGAASSLLMEGARTLSETLTASANSTSTAAEAEGGNQVNDPAAVRSNGRPGQPNAAADHAGANGVSGQAPAAASSAGGGVGDGAGSGGTAGDGTAGGAAASGSASGGAASGGTASGGKASDGTAAGGTAAGGTAAGGTAAGGTAAGGTAAGGTAAGAGPATAAPGAAPRDAAASDAAPGAANNGSAAGNDAPSAATSTDAVNGQAGSSEGRAGSSNGNAAAAAAGGAGPGVGSDDRTSSASGQGADGSTASSSNSAGAEGSATAPDENSTKAGQTVSWFQENALGVITGILALIVLIIAWLLRRVNAARSDGRDGVITEAMVQEKLDQINLDLEGPGDPTRTPRQ